MLPSKTGRALLIAVLIAISAPGYPATALDINTTCQLACDDWWNPWWTCNSAFLSCSGPLLCFNGIYQIQDGRAKCRSVFGTWSVVMPCGSFPWAGSVPADDSFEWLLLDTRTGTEQPVTVATSSSSFAEQARPWVVASTGTLNAEDNLANDLLLILSPRCHETAEKWSVLWPNNSEAPESGSSLIALLTFQENGSVAEARVRYSSSPEATASLLDYLLANLSVIELPEKADLEFFAFLWSHGTSGSDLALFAAQAQPPEQK